ncbi:DNA glycosylase AlkZ-like family protein [Cellulomonas sp. URHE0023]|uniref:DNA glycosylase AlkZ-like family protein n=1 Tax=Cellulomonas sp. URHE0023 TaxID=1380354 RepID=UPI000553333B|nr:crosslink repair DNA glycosylase YcaQ family protein [Cellulomonas sp. URHE0023]
MPSTTWAQALAWRLHRHLLEPSGAAGVDDVVRRLGAVPAGSEAGQDLAIGLRRRVHAAGDVASSLADGRVIRTFAFRGAVHLLTPEDGASFLALRASSRMWELPSWVEYYGLAADDWPAFRATVRDALADGPLTYDELAHVVTALPRYQHLDAVFTEGAWTLIKPLAWQGDLCFAPAPEGQAAFQRLDHNPRWHGIPDLDDAGPRAIETYLRAYAPTSAEQVQYWLGEGLGAARKRLRAWLHGLGDRLVQVDVDGDERLILADDLDDLLTATASSAVHLLPGHDQWVLGPGTKDRRIVPPAARQQVSRGANVVVVGGVVRGTWTVRDGELRVMWADDVDARSVRAEVEAGAERLARTLGGPGTITVPD